MKKLVSGMEEKKKQFKIPRVVLFVVLITIIGLSVRYGVYEKLSDGINYIVEKSMQTHTDSINNVNNVIPSFINLSELEEKEVEETIIIDPIVIDTDMTFNTGKNNIKNNNAPVEIQGVTYEITQGELQEFQINMSQWANEIEKNKLYSSKNIEDFQKALLSDIFYGNLTRLKRNNVGTQAIISNSLR